MGIGELLHQMLFDYTMRTVTLGAAILGIVSGALGAYAVLRRQSLLGDAISHAALPGVVLAFLITRSKAPLVLLLGAAVAGVAATLLILGVIRTTRIKDDSALGLTLSVFFGFGMMLLTFAQRLPDATQAGLNKFLFGQAATLLERDVATMALLGVAAVLAVVIFWKEFKLLSFDPEFAATLGMPVRALDVLLTVLLVIAIVIGLQAVGVVLMSAMVVAPASAARQWTNRLSIMVVLSAAIGALSGVVGTMISAGGGFATGPTIVLAATMIVVVSLLFGAERGLAWDWLRQWRQRRQVRVEAVLSRLFELAERHGSLEHGHPAAILQSANLNQGGAERTLRRLAALGWARQTPDGDWTLTVDGQAEAQRMLRTRGGVQE